MMISTAASFYQAILSLRSIQASKSQDKVSNVFQLILMQSKMTKEPRLSQRSETSANHRRELTTNNSSISFQASAQRRTKKEKSLCFQRLCNLFRRPRAKKDRRLSRIKRNRANQAPIPHPESNHSIGSVLTLNSSSLTQTEQVHRKPPSTSRGWVSTRCMKVLSRKP